MPQPFSHALPTPSVVAPTPIPPHLVWLSPLTFQDLSLNVTSSGKPSWTTPLPGTPSTRDTPTLVRSRGGFPNNHLSERSVRGMLVPGARQRLITFGTIECPGALSSGPRGPLTSFHLRFKCLKRRKDPEKGPLVTPVPPALLTLCCARQTGGVSAARASRGRRGDGN